MNLNSILKIIFIAWAYIGWFCCVLAGKIAPGSFVLAIPALTWFLFIPVLHPSRKICLKLLALAALGLSFDGLAERMHWISLRDSDTHAPFWLLALWLHFVPSLLLLKFLFEPRIWLGVLAGALLGPLSYKSGEAFAVLEFSHPLAPLFYALFWAAFVPVAILWLRDEKGLATHGNT